MTKIDRLNTYLSTGATVTAKQITSMFGIANPTAAIHSLRSQGVCVYGNKVTLHDGSPSTKYRVGVPTKKMIKAAHEAGLFN